jgi:hypothetical protein
MFKKTKQIMVAVLILFSSATLLRADLSKDDEREANAYRLTKPKIAQFVQATRNLKAAFDQNPKMFDAPAGTEKKQNSMADMINATDRIPAAKKAIEDAGMTSKEYWTFQMAMLYAGTGAMVLKSGSQLPEGFSKENVEFYRANEAEFMKLGEELKSLYKPKAGSAEDEENEEEPPAAEEED